MENRPAELHSARRFILFHFIKKARAISVLYLDEGNTFFKN